MQKESALIPQSPFRSTPVTKQRLEKKFPNLFMLDEEAKDSLISVQDMMETHSSGAILVQSALEEATNYLAQFRADSIVQDAEEIRDALLLPVEDGDEVWK